MRTCARLSLFASSLVLFAPLPAMATDGVIEINQAKALAGGVTPSDLPGFPVEIGTSGSYRLTSNLDLGFLPPAVAANTTVIAVGASAVVSIDLNGFSILGPNTCSGTCTNSGLGHGITAATASIRNGTVKGMGGMGLFFSEGLVENVVLTHNGNNGIFLNSGSVSGSLARFNGAVGIEVVTGIVRSSGSLNNLGDGIRATLIDRCVAASNAVDGFEVISGSILHSVSESNTGAELTCQTSCSLTGNRFGGCSGFGCYGSSGVRTQIPAASNACGDAICP